MNIGKIKTAIALQLRSGKFRVVFEERAIRSPEVRTDSDGRDGGVDGTAGDEEETETGLLELRRRLTRLKCGG